MIFSIIGALTIVVVGCVQAVNLVLWLLHSKRKVHKRGGVLISGTSSGIGRQVAIALAEKGFTVFAGVRKVEHGESLQDEVPNGDVRPVIMDVTKPETIDETLDIITDSGVQLIGVVNNAGIGKYSVIEGLDLDRDIRSMLEVNVIGMFALSKKTVPLLRQSKGRVVIVSSIAALQTMPGFSAYCASKVGVEPLAQGLRLEVGDDVSVSIVRPGFVQTDILHSIDQLLQGDGGTGDESVRKVRKKYPKVYNDTNDVAWKLGMQLADVPEETVNSVVHALLSSRPKLEYHTSNCFGIPAFLVSAFVLLPVRVQSLVQQTMLPVVGNYPEQIESMANTLGNLTKSIRKFA